MGKISGGVTDIHSYSGLVIRSFSFHSRDLHCRWDFAAGIEI